MIVDVLGMSGFWGRRTAFLNHRSGFLFLSIRRRRCDEQLKAGGFSGKVSNTSLHDVIQLICISGKTCRMQVRSRAFRGAIYFKAGEIVHAHDGRTEGEEAFYEILSWGVGFFECDDAHSDRQTIRESWDFLLMESMRRADAGDGS
jgi:hypothetical protein